eukprot:5291697-Pyramimonas_sp.AAC.1
MGFLTVVGALEMPLVHSLIFRGLVYGQIESLPRDILGVLLVFLPKGGSKDDVGAHVFRAPENARPLSMANAGAKLLSSCMCRPLSEAAQQ